MRKQYDQEYKEYVAKLIVEEGRKQTGVAYELEIATSTVGRWVKNYREKMEQSKNSESNLTPSEVEKLMKKHQREVEKLREENEILKKAMHIFKQNQE
ncbi:transposase [Bacillus kexueae]|uniref:transposase n=1 Tax=Aeribacillus kexueae TaxID=2078952 RepID=UPI001FAE866A|nr:transposase [Bacillus kexueae]